MSSIAVTGREREVARGQSVTLGAELIKVQLKLAARGRHVIST